MLKIRFAGVAKRQRGSINKFVNQPAADSMNRVAAAAVISALQTCQNKLNHGKIMRAIPSCSMSFPTARIFLLPHKRRMNRQVGDSNGGQRRAWPSGFCNLRGGWLRPELPSRRSCLGHQCRRFVLGRARIEVDGGWCKAWVGICVKE